MLSLSIRNFGQDEWAELVSQFQDLSLLQTWEYGLAKARTGSWKVQRGIFLENEHVVGAFQALVRTIPGLHRGLVWINRGPLWERDGNSNSSRLLSMIGELRRYWVHQRHMYLRVAPSSREGQIEPGSFQEIGYCLDESLSGWASARVDLFQPAETLRGQLQQKWRNCLNKAERLGLVVESGSGASLFEGFLAEYSRMLADRRYHSSVTPALLSRLQAVLPPERKLWVLAARQGECALGSVLLARYGAAAEYLAGTVNEDGRRVNAGQLLLWCALCEMKDQGYRWFDMGGMDPERTPSGIFHFKAGVGGTPHRLIGEIEAHDGSWISRILRSRVHHARQAVGV